MTELNECIICMTSIGDINCVTTECGHKFHANCIFTNIQSNGYKCPCCRKQMIEDKEEAALQEAEDFLQENGDFVQEHELVITGSGWVRPTEQY